VIGGLQRAFPGFFTAAKASPYDAATWSVIAPRMNMQQAARIKEAIAVTYGDAIGAHHVFPRPAVLAAIEKVDGLSEEKLSRLRGVGIAAMRGALDVSHLRALGETAAIASLQEIRGIGPWSASHIYYRGAASVDALPGCEPRLLHGLGLAYGLEAPSEATFARIAETWRPFRMWASILLMRNLARSDRWNAPGLAAERADAGKRAKKTAQLGLA
jgi:DNA-3-methyladenine glycosylase II